MNLCAARGCDGVPQARAVWADGPIVLRTCPVRAFTAEVVEWLAWFSMCYAIEARGFGGVSCVRTGWPAAGGAGDQDARLILALAEVAAGVSAVLAEQAAAGGSA